MFSLARWGAGRLLKHLLKAYGDQQDATTERERIAADVKIKAIEAEIASQQSANEVRRATAGQWEMRLIVFLVGFPVAAHFACVCLVSAFPGAFPGWTVHALPAPMNEWQAQIILSLFGLKAVAMGIGILARR